MLQLMQHRWCWEWLNDKLWKEQSSFWTAVLAISNENAESFRLSDGRRLKFSRWTRRVRQVLAERVPGRGIGPQNRHDDGPGGDLCGPHVEFTRCTLAIQWNPEWWIHTMDATLLHSSCFRSAEWLRIWWEFGKWLAPSYDLLSRLKQLLADYKSQFVNCNLQHSGAWRARGYSFQLKRVDRF